MQPIAYVYADDTTHTLTDLGAAHQALCAAPQFFSETGMLLHTCQRIEWYAVAESLPPALALLGRSQMFGERSALVRLAQIAAGSRSLIPGERFIHRQVQEAGLRLLPDHPLYAVTRDALALASRAREEFGLYARTDYSDLPGLFLTGGSTTPQQLLVVGGGMLARAVAAAPPHGYHRVVMMTRGPRKLRRLVEGLGNVTVVRHPSLDKALADEPYDTVIATTNLHGEYREHVRAAITGPRSRRVLDLCCTPALTDRPDQYHHLYDPDVLGVLTDANADMASRALQARQWIAQNVEVRV
ncbi:hypothetical protein [Streptomyces sp. NPDC021020]|uniref:hypothetical protein n=1 Tax=Streptomyces sp. NPDC021020 TaxID=3365109 RepID=UPI0037BA6656